MPGSEEFVQRTVHALEVGELAIWIKRCLFAALIAAIGVMYLYQFRGFASSHAMDQAQIGRALASGHGWRTNFVRPRAIGQLLAHGKNVPQKIWSDTYNAPLPPLVDAIALSPFKSHWKMSSREVVYAGDRAIAVMSVLLFALSLVVLFFTACRLFDRKLAGLVCGLVLLCDMMWQYSFSGLPQLQLLLLFNTVVYLLVRAVEAQYEGGRIEIWLAGIGVAFGLLALTHALTLWIFAATLVFAVFFFRPRVRSTAIVLAMFAIVYLPWLIRNFFICGNPAGVAVYSLLDGLGHSEAGWMRRITVGFQGIGPAALRDKFLGNLITQSGHLFQYFGLSVVAVMFFAALLYRFRRRQTAMMRWMLLVMWTGAVFGMALYGVNEEDGVAANQLHLIFVPMMSCYGLAYLLVQWRRLGIELRLARIAFIALLYFLCAGPMIFVLFFSSSKMLVRWPPYMPPLIAVLNDWMKPQEITASDMPWAVAWYADRRSIWLPETIKEFTELSDYKVLGAPINGLYLTPVSGTENTYGDIMKGEYRDWAPVIQRTIDPGRFPLKWATLGLGLESECVFFSDHDRQKAAAAHE
jgi:hypothetical protein